MASDNTAAAKAYIVLLALVGAVLLWRYVVSPKARASTPPSPLPEWKAEPVELLFFLLLILLGSAVFAVVAGVVVRQYALTGDARTLIGGAAGQLGMLGGVLAFAAVSRSFRGQAKRSVGSIVLTGAATFVISWPILEATSAAWQLLLRGFGIPAEPQDLIRMFAQAKSSAMLTTLIVLATVVAPFTEELIFRGAFFRFLRTRIPRFLALLVPALIFASLHIDWSTLEGFTSFAPLLVLALLFSLAYERTGHIGTTIVAHALFNLNTIVLILWGITS
jgi:membrane protease YdiL (CAAX protease family)